MKTFDEKHVKNIVLIGATKTGKTTLAETMMFEAGLNNRRGTVEDKMLDLQARKAGLADSLLSGVASDAALTTQDFDEPFKPLGGE